jgi:hypothetical protein
MNTCTDVRGLLPLVVGGDLEEDQALLVTEHLETGCEACANDLKELQRLRGHLLELPQRSPAPAVDLWPGVRSALLADGFLRSAPIVVRRARTGARGAWLSAAAATLLVAGAVWSLRGERSLAVPGPGAPEVADSQTTPPGVTPDLAPTLAGGAGAGGLRPLAPGEQPFSLEAELLGPGASVPLRPRALQLDPARPTLAGDSGGH